MLAYGITVGDAVVTALVIGIMLLLGQAVGIGFDRWLDAAGY